MKKCWYNARIMGLDQGSFTLLVFTTARGMRGEFKVFYSRLTVMDKD